ncbi:MAG: tetratricopeptide repeat protein [Candidatus Methylomirabilales bacterium]
MRQVRHFKKIGLLLLLLVAIPGQGETAGFTEVRDAVALWDRVFGRVPALEQFIQEGRPPDASAIGPIEATLKEVRQQEGSNPFFPLAAGALTIARQGDGFHGAAAKASALAGDHVAVRWLLYRAFLQMGAMEAASEEIRQIRRIRDQLGLDRIAYLGWHLAHWAEELAATGDFQGAEGALALAEEFDPKSPIVSFARARIFLRRGSPRGVVPVVKGWWESLTSPFYGLRRWADILASLLLAIPLSVLLVGIFLILRATPLFQHDLVEGTRKKVPPAAQGFLPILLYLFPIILGLGILPAIFLSLLPLGIYLKVRERILWGAMVFSLLLLPAGYRTLATFITATTSPRTEALLRVEEGDRGKVTEAVLHEWAEEAPQNFLPRFYLGRVNRSQGELRRAVDTYSQAQTLAPEEPAIWTNRGNLAFLAGDLGQARADYEKAIALDPDLPYPRFTLSQVLTERLLFDEAQREYSLAVSKNPVLGSRLHQAAADGRKRVIVDAPLPQIKLWRQILFVDSPSSNVAEVLWGRRFLGVSLVSLPWVVGGYIAAFVGILLFRKRRRFARACQECGRVFCPRCQRLLGEVRLCTRCAIIERAREGTLPPGVKAIPPEELQGEPRWLGLALSLIPGGEGLYRGRTVWGFLLLFVTLIVASPLLGRLLAPATYLPGGALPYHVALSIVLLFCLYLLTALTYTGSGTGRPREGRWR